MKKVSMGSKVIGMAAMLFIGSVQGFGQSLMSSSMSLVGNEGKVIKEVDYIDKDGNAGTLTGLDRGNGIIQYTFVCTSEIGELFETYYLQDKEIIEVVVEKTDYNRPKFWTERYAKANDDDEWFDPEKSVSEKITYNFENGELTSWHNEEGETRYVVTNAEARREKIISRRYSEFSKALK